MKKINWRIAAAVALALAFTLFTFAVIVWMTDASSATEAALQALNSDSSVYVSAENGWVIFYPAQDERPATGFVFYPGADVDYRAYAPALKLIAAKGYFIAVVPAPLNLAFFDVNAAARVQAAYPEIENWFVGGHSLGGVAALSYAADHPDIRGVALWAAYPSDDALKARDIRVVCIYGTNDGLVAQAMINDARELLPADALFVPIAGGNHAQFGSYGAQTGDQAASISPEEQWTQTADVTAKFFAEVLK